MRVSTTATEQFSIGRVVERTFKAFGSNFVAYAVIAVIFVALPTVAVAWIQQDFLKEATGAGRGLGLFGSPVGWAESIGIQLFHLAMGAAAQAAIIYGVTTGLAGRQAGLGEMLSKGLANWWLIVLIVICTTVMSFLGYLLIVVPGLMLAIRWLVAVPAQVMEGRGVFASMGRSAELTKGNRWSIFGLLLVSVLIMLAIELVIGLVVAPGIAFAQALNSTIFQLIAAPLLSLVITPLFAAGAASLYFELRSTKEGVGVEKLASVFD
jgi:hypothetical protein